MSPRKISAARRRDFDCSRRMMPPLNQLKRECQALLASEKQMILDLLRDDDMRRSIRAHQTQPQRPASVWLDCDQTWDLTKVAPYDLPEWRELSERMKMFIAFDYAMELGSAYPFTINISPKYAERLEEMGAEFMANVRQRIRRELEKFGMMDLPYCFVVETRTRSGKSRCRPHLHGFAICDDPIKATMLKVAFENAFAAHLKGRERGRAVRIERGYSKDGAHTGRFRWVSYMTKNVHFYDPRLGRRRLYMNREFTAFAREGWRHRREESLSVH